MGEAQKLRLILSRFRKKQEARLLSKARAGWQGWDFKSERMKLLHKLLWNVVCCEWVDVGNIAMFLWYLDGEKEK